MPSKLGLDELRNVVEMITPEYSSRITNVEQRHSGLEPYLSRDDRTALCSLSLSCKALRKGSQRALMRFISIKGSDIPCVSKFLDAKYQENFPVRKLIVADLIEVIDQSTNDTLNHLVGLLKKCSVIEFLCLKGWRCPQTGPNFDCTPIAHFNHLITFQYLSEWSEDPVSLKFFASMIAGMPRLRNLFTQADITPEILHGFPPVYGCQLEVLSLLAGFSGQAARRMLCNSSESLHTLQLSWLYDNPEVMGALEAFLDIAGSRLRVLHVWGVNFHPNSIVSLIHACPNLEELGINIFDADEIFPVTDAGEDAFGAEDHPAALAEQIDVQATMVCATMLIINALRSPLLRLHIIYDNTGGNKPADGLGLPNLCRALRRGHEKLANLEFISLDLIWDEDFEPQHINLNPEKGIVAACKEMGLRILCSGMTESIEWRWD